MPWIQISMRLGHARAEQASQDLSELGAAAVTLEDAEDTPVLEPAPGATPLWPDVIVTAMFELDQGPLMERIRQLPAWSARKGFQVSALPDRAWEREWLKDFRPMRFGRNLWVLPGDSASPDPDAITLRLDPGLAFGTGTHATTALCLEWLDDHPPAGLRVVDYGCGSGILGIAAALLGAASVIAVDNDPQALTATVANALRNGVGDMITVGPSTDTLARADLLLANILAGPLAQLASDFARAIETGGTVVLSGILAGQADEVATAYEPWFLIDEISERDGWVRISAQRKETG
ncbi:MAG: 50S ribosomal protein L11 methyltransferase [Chromatiales bacterium]|nr:50S ribosomal protein L11 methyltransferase [Chromatiales bacterium]